VGIVERCYGLIPDGESLTPTDESIAILLLYRALFNRFYELHPDEFAPSVVGDRPVGKEVVPDGPPGTGFDFFAMATFASNPLDALYYVHEGIMAVQAEARRQNGLATDEFFSWDTLFSLLSRALLENAPFLPDIFFVAWMVGQFAPTDSLSPSFDYAKATIEGLAEYCGQLGPSRCSIP
jgi:hypothetical protein